MKSKKYYTISEVTHILNVRGSQLRYLEKALSTLRVIQVKGRRYYTNENIKIIQSKLSKIEVNSTSETHTTTSSNNNTHQSILMQVDKLIEKFNNILTQINYTTSSSL